MGLSELFADVISSLGFAEAQAEAPPAEDTPESNGAEEEEKEPEEEEEAEEEEEEEEEPEDPMPRLVQGKWMSCFQPF
jgi:ubiquinol-cytochrome c reductase subunit 6